MTTAIEKYDSGLSVEKHNALVQTFNPLVANLNTLVEQANTIEVKDAADTAAMKNARTIRLALKQMRVDVEHARKELKESALREGKAIDGMANIIKFMIVPVEENLRKKEDFVRIAEERRIAALVERRTLELQEVDVDCTHFDLGAMTDAAYQSLLESSTMAYKAKKEAEERERQRLEAERIAREKAEAEERKRQAEERKRIEAENARLRKEAEERERQLAAEREQARKEQEARERKEAQERAKIEAEKRKAEEEAARLRRADQERLREEAERKAAEELAARDAELARIKAEKEAEQARLAAPDKEKIAALVDAVCRLELPTVSSDVALKAIHQTRGMLNGVVKTLRSALTELDEAGKE